LSSLPRTPGSVPACAGGDHLSGAVVTYKPQCGGAVGFPEPGKFPTTQILLATP